MNNAKLLPRLQTSVGNMCVPFQVTGQGDSKETNRVYNGQYSVVNHDMDDRSRKLARENDDVSFPSI